MICPERAHLVKPCVQLDEPVWAKPVEVNASILVNGVLCHQAVCPEHAEMPAHGRCARARVRGQLTGPPRSLEKEFDDLAASRLCQRGERGVQLINHQGNY